MASTGSHSSSARRQRLVVICAGTAFDGHPFSERQLSLALAKLGPVLYVDPPLSIRAAIGPGLSSLRASRLVEVEKDLWRLTVVTTPGPHRSGSGAIADAIMRAALRRALRHFDDGVEAVILATTAPMFGGGGERVRVLWGTDDFVAGASLMGVSQRRLRRRERSRLNEADLALAVSEQLAARWRSSGLDVRLYPNGVDYALFKTSQEVAGASDVVLRPPIAGFIGHLSDRIDVELLDAVAARGHSLLLVGPRQRTFSMERISMLLARPNVQWIGARPIETLPSYLRLVTVGLVPYTDTAFNRASFPLKTLEYLAAGLPIVSTPLPANALLGADTVVSAAGPEAFADAVGSMLSAHHSSQTVASRQAVAARFAWSERASELLAILESSAPSR